MTSEGVDLPPQLETWSNTADFSGEGAPLGAGKRPYLVLDERAEVSDGELCVAVATQQQVVAILGRRATTRHRRVARLNQRL